MILVFGRGLRKLNFRVRKASELSFVAESEPLDAQNAMR